MANYKYINFKNISDDLQDMVIHHKQINSYGLGDTDQMSYWTQLRLKDENPTYESPFFPLLYIVPSKVTNGLRYKEWELNCIMSDIVDRDLTNQVDVLSDTLQMLQDVMSQFRLSVSPALGCFNEFYYLDETINYTPFLEKYSDLTNGWNALLKIKTMTPLDRCEAAYDVFTGSPIIHNTINFKTFHDDFRLLADYHKQLNSFGFGALEDISYWTESRLKQDNPTYESPFMPLLYVVPSDAQQIITDNGSDYTEYTFNCIVMDILDRDLTNQVDVLSDTLQILDDIISQFRLSVTQSLGCFNAKYYLDDYVECFPFFEKFPDLCGGWNGVLKIKVMNALDRCDAAFDPWITNVTPTPTPSNDPQITPTPTATIGTTPTPTPTKPVDCPIFLCQASPQNIYSYNARTNTATYQFTYSGCASLDMALTDTQLFYYDGCQHLWTYNYTYNNGVLNKTFVKEYNPLSPYAWGAGLCAKDNNTLISSSGYTLSNTVNDYTTIFEYNLTTSGYTGLFQLPYHQTISGDLLYSPQTQQLVLASCNPFNASDSNITCYDLSGNVQNVVYTPNIIWYSLYYDTTTGYIVALNTSGLRYNVNWVAGRIDPLPMVKLDYLWGAGQNWSCTTFNVPILN